MKKTTTPLKTNSELLAELPEPIRKIALGNIRLCQAGKYPMEENTVSEALICSFLWHDTPQGYDYWDNIHLQLINLKNN